MRTYVSEDPTRIVRHETTTVIEVGGEKVKDESTYELLEIGNLTVGEPDWLNTAEQESP